MICRIRGTRPWTALRAAKLTVTITFTDGSEQTRSMTLHTGKLGVEYKDDTSGPSLTGEVLTDEQAAAEGYIYGVYADIE